MNRRHGCEIQSFAAQMVETPTSPATVETFNILGFTPEIADDLKDIELTCTRHSDKSSEYTATWQEAEDCGWIEASWRIIKDTTTCEVIYKYSEDDMEEEFGPGDYSCSDYSINILTWTGKTNSQTETLNPELPTYDIILEARKS